MSSDNLEALPKGMSLFQKALSRFFKNKMAVASLFVVIFYGIVALLAPWLPIHGFEEQVLDHQNLPPSLTKNGGELLVERLRFELEDRAGRENRSLTQQENEQLEKFEAQIRSDPKHARRYLLGTDYLGRDMLSRIIYGGQISMVLGLIGALTSILIGLIVGGISGYFGGRIDSFLMRFVDILYSLPYMLLVIIFMAVFGKNIFNLVFALAGVSWLTEARLVRGMVLSLKNSEFIQAARVIGASTPRILVRHLFPNVMNVVIIFTTLRIPSFILMEAFLSFLGLGVSAPMASWGSLVEDAVGSMTIYPWRLIFPALAMVIFLFCMNFLGEGLREAYDPHSEKIL
jgi:oligopeptide transport system permease protein